jgi:Fur family transcriptional regulator, ferric uptake regulator
VLVDGGTDQDHPDPFMVRKSAKAKGDATGGSDDVKTAWRSFLTAKRLHDSKPRDTVVDAFLEITDHIDLETLLDAARRRDPSVSMATVYRTMKLMEEAGLAHAQHFTAGPAVYEVAIGREHHDHLICESCGAIVEFVSHEIERQQDKVAKEHGFEVTRHRHELYGRCAACRRRR